MFYVIYRGFCKLSEKKLKILEFTCNKAAAALLIPVGAPNNWYFVEILNFSEIMENVEKL